jgi:phosphoribosylformimino-5-aminoimidazole carboxamide ribotide isomerase
MQIFPVIDLMGGVVVRGVAGRRSEYRPIESRLCNSAEPAIVAQALVDHFQFEQLYVADLDAIAGAEPAWETYERIAACGVRLLVDAGVAELPRASALSEFSAAGHPLAGVIVGLETLESPRPLREIAQQVGPERLIFSLDMQQGQPITRGGVWTRMNTGEIAMLAHACGARRMILLDLADVGVGQGVSTAALCADLRGTEWGSQPSGPRATQLIAGGGVRGRADIDRLAAAGCKAVLVASALHDGRLTAEAVRAIHGATQ